MRTGSTPPPEKNAKFKFWPKIQRVSPYNFGSRGIYLHQSLPGDLMNLAGVIICVQFLEGLPPKICEGKNVQISARFPTTFDFDPEYLRNRSTYRTSEKKLDQPQPLPHWTKEIW